MSLSYQSLQISRPRQPVQFSQSSVAEYSFPTVCGAVLQSSPSPAACSSHGAALNTSPRQCAVLTEQLALKTVPSSVQFSRSARLWQRALSQSSIAEQSSLAVCNSRRAAFQTSRSLQCPVLSEQRCRTIVPGSVQFSQSSVADQSVLGSVQFSRSSVENRQCAVLTRSSVAYHFVLGSARAVQLCIAFLLNPNPSSPTDRTLLTVPLSPH